ncbi:MAG: TMEM175 family protein [Micromonosporaceae bacterium]
MWIAHSNMTRFIKAVDPPLMRLNLVLLLFVSFLPFTTAIVATHLFASFLPFSHTRVSSAGPSAERVAVVLFGLNLTLAALMLYLVIRYADARLASRPATWPRKSCRPSPKNAGPHCCSRLAPPSLASFCW